MDGAGFGSRFLVMSTPGETGASPHPAGDFGHQSELALIVRRHGIAGDGTGEAKLRADGEALDGHDLRSFLDASAERVNTGVSRRSDPTPRPS